MILLAVLLVCTIVLFADYLSNKYAELQDKEEVKFTAPISSHVSTTQLQEIQDIVQAKPEEIKSEDVISSDVDSKSNVKKLPLKRKSKSQTVKKVQKKKTSKNKKSSK
jgi:hypothetical protein